MTMNDDIREKVKSRMKELGLSQYKLDKEHGISQAAVSRFLSGKRYNVPDEIHKLLEVLGLNLKVEDK